MLHNKDIPAIINIKLLIPHVPSLQNPCISISDLLPEQLEKIVKLCKFAISSLDYEDKNGAIDNFTRALNLL